MADEKTETTAGNITGAVPQTSASPAGDALVSASATPAQKDIDSKEKNAELHEHPPVSHLMPQGLRPQRTEAHAQPAAEVTPSIHDAPPVTTSMPAPPTLKLDIDTAPPPDYAALVAAAKLKPQKKETLVEPPVAPPAVASVPVMDLGSSLQPNTNARPETRRKDIAEILKSVQLPQKKAPAKETNTAHASSEVNGNVPHTTSPTQMDDVLAAQIVESSPSLAQLLVDRASQAFKNVMPSSPRASTATPSPSAPVPEKSPVPQPAVSSLAASMAANEIPSESKPTITLPVQDDIEASVGLVRPKAKGTPPPEISRGDMAEILRSVQLPEKRSAAGQAADAPRTTEKPNVPQPPQLNDILSARAITSAAENADEKSNPSGATRMPEQEMFHEPMQIESMHTLKQDLQTVAREQKMSAVRAVALEQVKKHPEPFDTRPKQPSRTPLILFFAGILLVLGIGALGGVYYVATLQATPTAMPQNDSLVFAEQTAAFQITNDPPSVIKTRLAQARTAGGTLGSLMRVDPVVNVTNPDGTTSQRNATLSQFFTSLGAEPPDSLMRALSPEFFFGVHTVDKNAPVLVIQVTDYDNAFDGMLAWEKTLNADLAPVFAPVPRLVMGKDGISEARTFSDIVMRNYDVRALKDDTGTIQLYYSFPTRNILVIAESPYTFTEILSRLQAGRRL